MSNPRAIVAMGALALSAGAAANVPAGKTPSVYIEGSQYTAVLNQRTQAWRLFSGDGVDLEVSAAERGCRAGRHLPPGIWLVTRDADGRPVLTAPSVTELPPEYPEQVPLRACDAPADGRPHVAAPQGLIDWLTYNTGAIYIEN